LGVVAAGHCHAPPGGKALRLRDRAGTSVARRPCRTPGSTRQRRFEVNEVFAIYSVFGTTVLVLALGAGVVKTVLWISEPVLALAVGVLVGPVALGLFDPAAWGNDQRVLEELARLTLAVSLMGAALRLPDRWVKQCWRPLLVLLLLGMPLMWSIASLCGVFVLGLPLLQALLLAAVLTPTDPVAASTIVTGRFAEEHIDADVRHLVSAEAGANDGLAYLLVALPMLLLEDSPATSLQHWLLVVCLGQVLGSMLGGALFGYLAARLMVRVYHSEHAYRTSLLATTVAMSLTVVGIVNLLHGDGILAVFAAGLVFNWAARAANARAAREIQPGPQARHARRIRHARAALEAPDNNIAGGPSWSARQRRLNPSGCGRRLRWVVREEEGLPQTQHSEVQETVKRFLDVPVFLFFGMVLPWQEWLAAGPSAWVFAAAVVLFRRIPVLLLLHRFLPPVRSIRDAMFVGWFGPIAVAAMLYATWPQLHGTYPQLWTVASLVIFVSIVVHGVSATPLTRLYAHGREVPG